ncbi:hypothetical protein K440DRAFT_554676, partial [Wilcoxina mikolae CBS 423.85]
RTNRRAPTYGLGSGYHAVDKARYVNSNYRFIVNPRGDYKPQAVDSDVHLPWDHILQVLAPAITQCPNCPICLSTPVAPRMAKCGHIFCLPCLVRYMASQDGDRPTEKKPRYKRCVICTDSVYMNDIRPVRFFTGQQNEPPRDGEDVVLRLVMRQPGSTLALPKDGADPPSELGEIPWHFAAEVMDYARVMKGTEDYMMEQFNREIRELEQMQQEDELMFGEEGVWSRKAVGMIQSQMEGLTGMGNPPPPPVTGPQKLKEKEKRPPIVFTENADDVPEMYHILHEARSDHVSQSHPPVPQIEEPPNNHQDISTAALSSPLSGLRAPRPRSVAAANAPHDSPYYFYQALLHYYLSPLDIRILKVAFGSFNAFPSTILPRVENVSTGHTVDDDLRKRAKYLAHLPYGCEVGFLECDWTDIVPPETLEKFMPEIERRRKKKRDKEMKEERDRIRAEKLEDEEKWSAVRQRRRESIVKGESKDADSGGADAHDGDFASFSTGTSPSSGDNQFFGSSGKSVFASLASSSPSDIPAHHRTVWGTPAIATNEEPVRRRADDTGGWLPDWEQEFLLEEEMLAQIEMEESLGDGGAGGRAPSHGKGQKKKKFKKVTLMTNGGRRGA